MSVDSALASTPVRPPPSAGLPRVAATLALLFVVLVWGGIFLREAAPSAGRLLGQGIGSTGAAFLTPIALVVVVGLWLRATWGWWFSLIVTGYQAVSYALFLVVVLASGDATGALTWLTGLWLLAMLFVLLLPGTRRACTASS